MFLVAELDLDGEGVGAESVLGQIVILADRHRGETRAQAGQDLDEVIDVLRADRPSSGQRPFGAVALQGEAGVVALGEGDAREVGGLERLFQEF